MQDYPINSGQICDLKFGNLNELVTQQTTSFGYIIRAMDVGETHGDGVPVSQTLVRLQRLSDS